MRIELEVDVNGVSELIKLEYNRDAIKSMEARGFSIHNFDEKFATNGDLMIWGAMRMHHKQLNNTVTNKIIDAIYEEYDATELYAQLTEMIVDSIPQLKDSVSEAGGEKKKKSVIIR